jgi:hypothetical protein
VWPACGRRLRDVRFCRVAVVLHGLRSTVMTLVLAVATKDFSVVLADRCVTTPSRSEPGAFEYRDSDTKTIIMNGAHALCFAGLATVGRLRQRMEFWVMDQFKNRLTKEELSNWPDRLSTQFGEACEEVGYFGKHTFVAPGYYLDSEGSYQPEIIVIENKVFPHSFDISFQRFESPKAVAVSAQAGVDLSPELIELWKTSLDVICGQHARDLDAVINLMVRIWAAVAGLQASVGKTAIVTSFPSSAVPLQPGAEFQLAEPPPEVYLTQGVSMTLALEGSETYGRIYLPARVSEGMMMGGVVSGPRTRPRSEWLSTSAHCLEAWRSGASRFGSASR